jgi:hypothetical protein
MAHKRSSLNLVMLVITCQNCESFFISCSISRVCRQFQTGRSANIGLSNFQTTAFVTRANSWPAWGSDSRSRSGLIKVSKDSMTMTTSQEPSTTSLFTEMDVIDDERRLPITEYFKPLVEGDRLESTATQQLIVLASAALISAMFYQTWMLSQISPVQWPIMLAAVLLGYEFADFG